MTGARLATRGRVAAYLIGALACDDPAGPVSAVLVSPETATVEVGEQLVLSAATVGSRGAVITGTPVLWTSSDVDIAPVRVPGAEPGAASTVATVTGVTVGLAIITATADGLHGSAAVTVVPRATVASLRAGLDLSCDLDTRGRVFCWGSGGRGELGRGGTETAATRPAPVIGGLVFRSLGVGGGHACGVTTAGAAYCWGRNDLGQLGDGTLQDRSEPTLVAGGHTFRSVTAGESHTCAVTADGEARCWGSNGAGQLGIGTRFQRTTPGAVSGGLSFQTLSAGGTHTCGLTASGELYCWGSNASGQLGAPSSSTCGVRGSCSTEPLLVSITLNFRAVAAGRSHTCAVDTGGDGFCWGGNAQGQLGDGTTDDRSSPTAVAGGREFESASAGGTHSCAVDPTGAGFCWGANTDGQLGDGSGIGQRTPTRVAGGLVFANLSAGLGAHTCGVTLQGIAYCWGNNSVGQIGDGSTIQRNTPVQVLLP